MELHAPCIHYVVVQIIPLCTTNCLYDIQWLLNYESVVFIYFLLENTKCIIGVKSKLEHTGGQSTHNNWAMSPYNKRPSHLLRHTNGRPNLHTCIRGPLSRAGGMWTGRELGWRTGRPPWRWLHIPLLAPLSAITDSVSSSPGGAAAGGRAGQAGSAAAVPLPAALPNTISQPTTLPASTTK